MLKKYHSRFGDKTRDYFVMFPFTSLNRNNSSKDFTVNKFRSLKSEEDAFSFNSSFVTNMVFTH